MNKNKEKNAYATVGIEKIDAKNKPKKQPNAKKTVGGDLRARRGQ